MGPKAATPASGAWKIGWLLLQRRREIAQWFFIVTLKRLIADEDAGERFEAKAVI